jgi:hypothetical protein
MFRGLLIVVTVQLNYGSACIDVSFQDSMKGLLNTTIQGGKERIWFYQTCTMYGGYMTCDPDSKCLFTSVGPLADTGSLRDRSTEPVAADARVQL